MERRSLEGTISLFRLSRRGGKEGLERAYNKLAVSKSAPKRGIRKGRRVAAERQGAIVARANNEKSFLRGYAARPLKSRKPEKQPRAALETSRRRPLVDKGAASSIKRHVGENIRGKMHRASMRSLEKRFLAANRKSLRARLSSFLLSAK